MTWKNDMPLGERCLLLDFLMETLAAVNTSIMMYTGVVI
jgi:hypothetical protein